MSTPTLTLTPLEARVIAVLVEKEHTVPDTYPLTLNALVTGCNQKTSRDPVMNVSEAEVREALDGLRRHALVIESSGSRVMRYSQNLKRVIGVPTESVALLVTLMLRGPQTAAELRLNCERLQRFSDLSALEGFLNELAERSAGALVTLLPRQPGARESRWTHLLCGAAEVEAAAARSRTIDAQAGAAWEAEGASRTAPPQHAGDALRSGDAGGADDALRQRVDRLERELAGLQALVARLCRELGVE